MQEFQRDPNLDDLEQVIQSLNLAPAPPAINRDRLLFEAGRAAARADRHVRFLAATTLLFAGSTMAVGYLLACQRHVNARLHQQLAAVASAHEMPLKLVESEPPVARELPESSYLALMRRGDLFSDQPQMRPSPPADAAPEVSPKGPEMNVLHLRSRLDF